MEKLNKKYDIDIVTLAQTRFVGRTTRISGKEQERPAMQEKIWSELEENGTLNAIREYGSGDIGGVAVLNSNFDRTGFDQFIGVTSKAETEEFEEFLLPAGDYAVFTAEEGQKTSDLWCKIYFEIVPRSQYVQTRGAELEVRCDGPVRIYIPVKERPAVERKRPRTDIIMTVMWMAVGLFVGLILSSGKDERLPYIALGLVIGGVAGWLIDKYKRSRMDAADKKAREEQALNEAEDNSKDGPDKGE